jgi:hypothetical protein
LRNAEQFLTVSTRLKAGRSRVYGICKHVNEGLVSPNKSVAENLRERESVCEGRKTERERVRMCVSA